MTAEPVDDGVELLVGLKPVQVLSASDGAVSLFGTGDTKALGRILFGSPAQMRNLGVRLDRLEPGSSPHLERMVITHRFRRFGVTLSCEIVSGSPGKTVRMRTARPSTGVYALGENGPGAPETEGLQAEAPESSLPWGQAMEGLEAPRTDAPPLRRAVLRFSWSTDASGIITHVGGEMAAHFGDMAMRVGDSLPSRFGELAPDLAVGISEAMACRRGWGRFTVAWPTNEPGARGSVVFAGTPSPQGGGYRGFGLILEQTAPAKIGVQDPERERGIEQPLALAAADEQEGEPESLEVEPSVPQEPAEPQAAEAETIVALSEDLGETNAAPAGLTEASIEIDVQDNVADAGRVSRADSASPDVTPLPSILASATAKVVHLSTFKTGVPVLSGRVSPRRDPARGDQPEIRPDTLDVPQWAEAPSAPEPKDASDQRLSHHERFNFDEIARALAALPTADPAGTIGRPGFPLGEAEAVGSLGARPASPGIAAADGIDPSNAPDAVAILDCLASGVLVVRSERVLYANRAMVDLGGFSRLADLQEADLGRLLRPRWDVRQGTSLAAQSSVLTARNGTEIEVEARIQTIAWHGEPATLVTVRRPDHADAPARQAALDLDLSKSRTTAADLAEALDLAASGAGFFDRKGRILSMNRGAERLFGYNQREIVGEVGSILVAVDQQAAWHSFFDGFASPSAQVRNAAFRKFEGRKRQGGNVPVSVSLRRIEGDRICVIWQESQSSHATASELEALRRDAERASAMKSELLAKVSHEIRTPLNAILGFTEVIMEERFGPVGNDRYREYLKDIHTSGAHVVSLINDLLDLSRIEAGGHDLELLPVDVNMVLAECVGTLQGQAHRDRIIIRTSLAARTPHALTDERTFRQIALNLLSNALKFNEPGGQVIVSSAIAESGQVVVRVRDTGLGMSADEIGTAMKPFHQLATPKAQSGSGLGLPLTKAMIEASHGTLEIESTPGRGTLVEVRLPSAPAPALSVPAE